MLLIEDLPEIETPWSSVGYLTFKRTYARKFEEEGDPTLLAPDAPTEEYEDTIIRTINAINDQFGAKFTYAEQVRLATYFLELKGQVAGRFLWQAGTKTVERFGLNSLQNCAFTVVDHPIRPFTWAMDMLALGSGVGFSVQAKHVDKIPPIKPWFKRATRFDDGGADFIVPDSREGWVKLLGKVLKAAFFSQNGQQGTFTFSTQVIRGKGSPIKGFGGTASGPEELCWGIDQIGRILELRRGKRLRPIDALDIMNIIAWIIVAGNVRRSAELAIGDPDDVEFLMAKRWDLGSIPKWRSMSNNSVAADSIDDLHPLFWETYSVSGEPYGLINLPLARSCGRLGDTQYKDPNVEGFNPCAEQGLEPYETCCLAEVFLPNITSYDELLDVVKLLYRAAKHSLTLPSNHPETQEVVHRNMRMGIGMSGIMQATDEQLSWLPVVYEELREFDKIYSAKRGLPPSIKLTTIKPSGTMSLLPGVTPGVHPGYSRYMIRRITVATDNPLLQECKRAGYPIEPKKNIDGTLDYASSIVSFPFEYPEGTILAKDVDAISQLETVKLMQTLWSDNSVSCTIYFHKEELPQIQAYLRKYYQTSFKTVSFLLHNEHGFEQAPFEEITEEEYKALKARTVPLSAISTTGMIGIDDSDCPGGACPIR